jgi:putative copper export protein
MGCRRPLSPRRMRIYEFLLFVHVAAAAVWVGGGAMLQFMV